MTDCDQIYAWFVALDTDLHGTIIVIIMIGIEIGFACCGLQSVLTRDQLLCVYLLDQMTLNCTTTTTQ